jgi:hypothetical protein
MIIGTFEKFENNQWQPGNNDLTFKDALGRDFSYYSHKIEVTYQGSSPVKEEDNYSFALNCSPNPASGLININYTIIEPQNVSLIITNSMGIEMARINNEGIQETGNYSINYDAGCLAPGVYLLTMRAGNYTETKKFVIIR